MFLMLCHLHLILSSLPRLTPPNASDLWLCLANFTSAIAVVSVIPFLIVANPVIPVFGVNVSSEIIAIKFPSLYHLVIFCVASA